jgi:hypothetical protein
MAASKQKTMPAAHHAGLCDERGRIAGFQPGMGALPIDMRTH